MTRTTPLVLPFFTILLGCLYDRSCVAQQNIPLEEAVATVNEEMYKYFRETDARWAHPLPEEKWPAPLTVDEVIATIRQFKPDGVGGKASLPIYQRIAESKVLPPRARLYRRDQWFDTDRTNVYEHRLFMFQLDVMTGEKTGYGLQIRKQTLDRRIALRPSEGYTWLVQPRNNEPVRGGHMGRLVWFIDENKEGSLVAFVARSMEDGIHELRAVAFDNALRRHELQRRAVGNNDTVMERFYLPSSEVPYGNIKYLGFEGVTDEGLKLVSELAVRQAKKKGIAILPLPEVGENYELSLTTSSGKLFDSQSLKGKVVLIDFWATWCGPCMKQMPKLKRQYEKWHAAGLEVLGVSFDDHAEAAEATYEELEIPWELVVIPSGEDDRRLWTDATRITALPTVLLIDQRGVLHSRLVGEEIDKELGRQVEQLLMSFGNGVER